MRVSTRQWFSLALILVAAAFGLSACAFRPLLSDVSVQPEAISPNADGQDDVTLMRYAIGRTAHVSIYVIDAQGNRYYFRDGERRSPGEYQVYWSGVTVDPEVRQVEGGPLLVSSHVLPDGEYTWVIEAVDLSGQTDKREGRITLTGGDTALPEIHNFVVVPQDFTPNQDGIHDRVSISYFLLKDAERVEVYLQPLATGKNQAPLHYPISEDPTASISETGKAGYHGYDYDGGVDQSAEPPPDGDYAIYAEAADKVGNRVVVSSTLTITEGGKPRRTSSAARSTGRTRSTAKSAFSWGRHSASPRPCKTTGRCRSAPQGRGQDRRTNSARTTTPWPSARTRSHGSSRPARGGLA